MKKENIQCVCGEVSAAPYERGQSVKAEWKDGGYYKADIEQVHPADRPEDYCYDGASALTFDWLTVTT